MIPLQAPFFGCLPSPEPAGCPLPAARCPLPAAQPAAASTPELAFPPTGRLRRRLTPPLSLPPSIPAFPPLLRPTDI